MSDWKTELDQAVDRHFEDMVKVRRQLHSHPEPSGEEHETTLFLYQFFGDRDCRVEMGPEGRGTIVDRSGNGKAPRVAMRADIDALRIQDRKQVPYCSKRPGIMHACGHDAHTATVVGAVLCLQDLEARGALPCEVSWRAVFQPSEETATGANEMIQAGALTDVKAIFATHVDPSRLIGHIGMRSGVLTANCDDMEIVVRGRGGHAARPHEANDPIATAAQLISTLYLFVPRATDSQDAVVITIGQLLGGDNPNVIPEEATLRGTLRTLDSTVRTRTIEHIKQLVRGIGEASGTQIEVHFRRGCSAVLNDLPLTELICGAAREVVGEDRLEIIPRPSMGSEDFSMYLQQVPGAMFRLGCASPKVGHFGLHTPMFDVDEVALRIGAKIMARAVINWSIQAQA